MLSAFERLARASRHVVERVHGTSVMIYPLLPGDPNAARGVDTASAYATNACFYENTLMNAEERAQPLTGDGRMLHRNLVRSASIRLVAGMPMQTGYLAKREIDGAWFTIGAFDPDGSGNILAVMNTAKTPIGV